MQNKFRHLFFSGGSSVIMLKFMAFSILTLTIITNPYKAFSQNEEIKIELEKRYEIDEIFKIIERQTSYNFIYRSNMFENSSTVLLKKENLSIDALLNKVFANSSINYKIDNNNIILTKKEEEEKQTITGVVRDEDDIPLQGVIVMVSETRKGVPTNMDGKYSIEAETDQTLVFNYLGYEAKEVIIDRNIIDVQLILSAIALDEVVLVSSGFQEISKERSTGAYETLTKDDLSKPSTSIAERLVGVIPGIQSTVGSNGVVSFEIRGKSSLYADESPLVVVDGFPIEGGFSAVNPNDVESVTVLKDAAAASIWGAKSANGVIVITTKSGSSTENKIEFSSFMKMSPKLDLDYTLGLAPAADALEYEKRYFDTNFFGGTGSFPGANVNSMTRQYSRAIMAMNEARLDRISDVERDQILSELAGLDNTGQISQYLLENRLTNQNNISFSGGNKNMQNRISFMQESLQGSFKGDKQDRYLFTLKNKTRVVKNLDFLLNSRIQYSANQNNGIALADVKRLAPWDMLVDNQGEFLDLLYLEYYAPNIDEFVPKDQFPYPDWSYNPITEVDFTNRLTSRISANMQAGLNLQIFEGLNLSSTIRYEKVKSDVRNVYGEETFLIRKLVNISSSWGFSGPVTQNLPSGSVMETSATNIDATSFRNQLIFNRTFYDNHEINFLAGTELSSRVGRLQSNPNVFGYNDNTLASTGLVILPGTKIWNGLSLGTSLSGFRLTPNTTFSHGTDRYFSLYGNIAYTLNRKYTISASARTDASNLITDDPRYRYNPFWSIGAGWALDREDLFMNIASLDRLKLRATFGYNGNVDKSTSFKPLINLGANVDQYTGEHSATVSSFGNPSLRWEKTQTLNIGLDYGFWKGKLNGAIDAYWKEGSSLIVTQSIASVNGTTSQKFNSGNMTNKGFELSVGTRAPLLNKNIHWSGRLSYAYNHSRITKFTKSKYLTTDLTAGGGSAYMEGYDPNTLWSFKYAGMMNEGTAENPVMKPSVYGTNGDKMPITITPSDNAAEFMLAMGTKNAPHIFGMYNSFKLYDFDISLLLTGKFGHVFNRQGFNYPSSGTRGNLQVNDKLSEVLNGDPEKIVPIPESESRYQFYDRFTNYMDYLVVDASHIRVQEVSVTYNLPKNTLNRIGLDQIRIFMQANNLGTILFNSYGEDPEYPKGGLKLQKSFTLGLNLNF